MSMLDEILKAIEESAKEAPKGKAAPVQRVKAKPKVRSKSFRKAPMKDLEIRGFPIIWPPLKWDELGLGPVRHMGFAPGRPVKLNFKQGIWTVTGGIVNSRLLLFILAGGGGLIYFLRDMLTNIKDWGWLLNIGIAGLIPVIGAFIRNRSLQFQPYEIEMLGFDTNSGILVFSTLTLPGGVVALKLDMPSDIRARKVQVDKLVSSLRTAHNGFIKIDGLANINYSWLRHKVTWALVWLLIYGIYTQFFAG